jgi:MATE family multidrug resistance protein
MAKVHPPGGLRELLLVSVPLILSAGSSSIQQFIDRVFLSHWSPVSVAAGMPAGALNFSFLCIFMGTAFYCGTFISQYQGAKRNDQIGPAMWQGVWIGLVGAIAMIPPIIFAPGFFAFFNHPPAVIAEEVIYFRILTLGTFPIVASSALSCFFSGRGDTWTVLWVNLTISIVNAVLDYAMIFGHGPFPAMGIEGAAIATVIAHSVALVIYLVLVLRPKNQTVFHTRSGWRFNPELMRRLLRFGLPSGLHWFVDIAGFTVFNLLLGQLGVVALAATNIAFQIDLLGLIPMTGIGIGVSILVGKYIGAGQVEDAERAGWSGMKMALLYIIPLSTAYVLLPDLFLLPFREAGGKNNEVLAVASSLLVFAAVVSIFDAVAIATSSAIKGAGDTHFVVWLLAITSPFCLILPTWLALSVFHCGLFAVWTIAITYWCSLAIGFFLRFRQGKWKTMKVIEEELQIPEVQEPIDLLPR